MRANNDQKNQLGIEGWHTNELKYNLTIRDWIDEFNLLDWDELVRYYDEMFGLNIGKKEWQKTMLPKKEKTLGDLCEFISEHAKKPEIKPLKLFGRYCEEASIFRYLTKRITAKHPNIKTIKPSSFIEKYMDEIYWDLIAETNLIAHGVLPPVKYKPGEFNDQGWRLLGIGLLIMFIAGVFDNWFIGGIGIGMYLSGAWTINKSVHSPSEQFEFEDIATFRGLVFKIKKYRNAAQQCT